MKSNGYVGLIKDAMSLLKQIAGPEKESITIPVGASPIPTGGTLQVAQVPLGWKFKVTRITWTCDAAGGVTALFYAGGSSRMDLVEVTNGSVVPGQAYAAYADAVNNNAELRAGENLSVTFFGFTGGGQATVRIQVEAERVGQTTEERRDLMQEEYTEEGEHEDEPLGAPLPVGEPVLRPHISNLLRRS